MNIKALKHTFQKIPISTICMFILIYCLCSDAYTGKLFSSPWKIILNVLAFVCIVIDSTLFMKIYKEYNKGSLK